MSLTMPSTVGCQSMHSDQGWEAEDVLSASSSICSTIYQRSYPWFDTAGWRTWL